MASLSETVQYSYADDTGRGSLMETPPETRTVFVAEHDDRLLKLIELTLSAEGYAVVSARRGAAVLTGLEHTTPSLIVLGRLPDLSAAELSRRIRLVPHLQRVPLLLTDGETTADAGTTLARPFTGTALTSAAKRLLGNSPSAQRESTHTVMVIEDSAALRGLITDILHRQGFGIETAENVPQARALIKRRAKRVSLVLLDVNLPGGTGFELLELIRKYSAVPVFILSALRQQEQIQRGQALGAQAFIEKPFNPRELVRKIRDVLT